MPRPLRAVESAAQSPAPTESPVTSIFSGRTALWGAFAGGLVKYKSETFLVSVARMTYEIYGDFTYRDNIMPRISTTSFVFTIRSITKTIELTMDTASLGIELCGSLLRQVEEIQTRSSRKISSVATSFLSPWAYFSPLALRCLRSLDNN